MGEIIASDATMKVAGDCRPKVHYTQQRDLFRSKTPLVWRLFAMIRRAGAAMYDVETLALQWTGTEGHESRDKQTSASHDRKRYPHESGQKMFQ